MGKDDQQSQRGDSVLDSVARKLRLPFSTPDFVNRIVDGSINQIGRRMLHMTITTWDLAGGGPFAANAIGSAGMAKTVDTVEGMLRGPILNPILRAIGADQIKLRASLCATQLIGLGVMRYAVRSEPLASMDVDDVVNAMGPTLQRYLVGKID